MVVYLNRSRIVYHPATKTYVCTWLQKLSAISDHCVDKIAMFVVSKLELFFESFPYHNVLQNKINGYTK